MSKIKPILISVFVMAWLVVFHYESIRYFYLQPLLKKELPKVKLLYPPAGWIMFFNVGPGYGYAQVYGVKEGRTQAIEPHDILLTRSIGYDNINRNALSTVLDSTMAKPFCDFLERKFPYYDSFIVTYVHYPNRSERKFERLEQARYQCP